MLLLLDLASEKPIYVQIRDQIVDGIARGELSDGAPLPTIRQLASDFAINPHTVNKAYELLRDEGFIELRRKTGAVVRVARPADAAALAAWEARLRSVLAEVAARAMAPEEILLRCRHILATFAGQEEGGEGTMGERAQ